MEVGSLEIKILQLLAGAGQATGLTVIIDVFRAFSVACYVMAGGAAKVIPVAGIQLAYQLKAEHPDYILIGERQGRIQPGFDYGNSPTQLAAVDFRGKTLVHTTSSGTQGLIRAEKAGEIITGSLVNAQAVAAYIRAQAPATVSLVAMGDAGIAPAEEDMVCAEYIKSLLENSVYDLDAALERLRQGAGRRFFDPKNADWSPEGDFWRCTAVNRFDFVLRAEKNAAGFYCLTSVRPD